MDLVITSDPELITDLVVLPHTTYPLQSDYFIVAFSIHDVVHYYQHRKVSWLAYDFNKADWDNLNRYSLYIALKSGEAIFIPPMC